MEREVKIREARDDDRAFMHDLGLRTLSASVSSFRDAPAVFVKASFEGLLDLVFFQTHVALVAERRDGTPVGYVLMLVNLPDEVTGLPQAFIAYMAVEPNAQSEGIGSSLLRAAEDAARNRGLPFLTMMVTEENEAARNMYARAGYVTERRLLCKPL